MFKFKVRVTEYEVCLSRKWPPEFVRETREMREYLTERQIDQTLEDSFPASDPPAWY